MLRSLFAPFFHILGTKKKKNQITKNEWKNRNQISTLELLILFPMFKWKIVFNCGLFQLRCIIMLMNIRGNQKNVNHFFDFIFSSFNFQFHVVSFLRSKSFYEFSWLTFFQKIEFLNVQFMCSPHLINVGIRMASISDRHEVAICASHGREYTRQRWVVSIHLFDDAKGEIVDYSKPN